MTAGRMVRSYTSQAPKLRAWFLVLQMRVAVPGINALAPSKTRRWGSKVACLGVLA
jgi:hypothetical protein